MGLTPTVRENEYIADLFNNVTVMGFLHEANPTEPLSGYACPKIRFKPLWPSGGDSLMDKLKVVITSFSYLFAIHAEARKLKSSDWVYVRCPCNIALIACLYLIFFRRPRRWFKYAGNWKPETGTAFSYRLQRFILRHNLCRGKVTINGEWKNQPGHVLSFYNPCCSTQEVEEAEKFTGLKKLEPPFEMLFVGRIEHEKGVGRILEIAEKLKQRKAAFHINLVGEGKDRNALESRCRSAQLEGHIDFTGFKSAEELKLLYQKAQLFILPSLSEGWPKVLSEAMNYFCIPIASDVSSIPQVFKKFDCGIALPGDEIDMWVEKIISLLGDPEKWGRLGGNGKRAMSNFTYEKMVKEIREKVLV
ncbi:glycosyltransferase [Fibrobacterota bacterium]